MKIKLPFLLLLLLLSVKGFAQATAYTVPNLTQCNNEVFDLTVQIAPALGNQNPANYSVKFYSSLANANAATNEITDLTFYVAPMQQTLYVRVTNLANNNFDVESFTVRWSFTPWLPDFANVTVCGVYVLPPLQTGNYFTGPMGTGTILAPGTAITTSQTIYVFAGNDLCWDGKSFTVTVYPTFPAGQVTSLIVCDYSGSSTAMVDLTSKTQEILNGQTGAIVKFFASAQAAQTGSPSITQPASYLAADGQVIYVRVENNVGCYTITQFPIAIIECSEDSVSGRITFDSDNNGCTAADMPAAGISIYAVAGNIVCQTFTNAQGEYEFNLLPTGNVVITPINNIAYSVTPSAHTVSLPGNGAGKNFCLTTPAPVYDVSVTVVPTTVARPGMAVTYAVIYKNEGNTTATGNLYVSYPESMLTFTGASLPQLPQQLPLGFAYTLLPYETKTMLVSFIVAIPPAVNQGDIAAVSANISFDADTSTGNNSTTFNTEIVNSYDPNDITVHEGENISLAYAQSGYLTYTVRFQNTGNADALNVFISSLIDENLNPDTFQPIASSHNYRVQRAVTGLNFYFDDINLPGTNDEPNSHGFITYKIKPKTAVAEGDTMQATADIFFDFNPPITTNTVTTTVEALLGVADIAKDSFTLYPNPANGYVTVKMPDAAAAEITIADVTGKTILKTALNAAESNIDIAALHSGMYFVTVSAEGKSSTKKLIVK